MTLPEQKQSLRFKTEGVVKTLQVSCWLPPAESSPRAEHHCFSLGAGDEEASTRASLPVLVQ